MIRNFGVIVILLLTVNEGFGQESFKQYKDSVKRTKSYFYNDISLLDSIDLLNSCVWEVRFVKKKNSRNFQEVTGSLNCINPQTSELIIDGDRFVGYLISFDDGSGFNDIFQISIRQEGLELDGVTFQVRKIERDILVLDFFDEIDKLGNVSYGSRFILEKNKQ